MRKVITVILIAFVFAGCNKKENRDTTEFKQVMIGYWKSTDENSSIYYYFDENTVSIYDQEYDVLKESYQYMIRSDEDDIYLDFLNSEITWIIVNYNKDSFSYEDTRLGTSDDVHQLTRSIKY